MPPPAAPLPAAPEPAAPEPAAPQPAAPPGQRRGHITRIGDFDIFVGEDYGPNVRRALESGGYELRERGLATEFLRPGDRVLEAGTGAGVIAMTAAAVTGAANVLTFEANPYILADARGNFARNGMPEITSHHAVLACRRLFRPNAVTRFNLSREFWASRIDAPPGHPAIVQTIDVRVRSLEQEIAAHQANVLICDIEGGEVVLLTGADLSGIRMIILETHRWAVGEALTDAMIRDLILQGFAVDLPASAGEILLFRRA
jgi:FkbM family methyltransferase